MTLEEHLIEELSKSSRGAADLAKVVSLAVLVEPQLLRRARIKLLPDVDAGAEADLWLSQLVQTRSARGITLLPRAAEHLRRMLAEDSILFEKAWKLTAEAHKSSPPTVKLEEEINRLSVKLDGDSLNEIERLLQSVVSTLVDHEERWGLAHWAAGALARMPEAVRSLEPARVLTAASYLRLSSHMPAESGGAPDGDLPEWLSWVMPKNLSESESEFRLGVELVEGGVRLGGSTDPKHTMHVPDTSPLLVELSWPEGGVRRVRQVRLKKGEQRMVSAPAGVLLRTMTGLCYELTPAAADEPIVARRVCFVSMPFGDKVDFETGRKLNMDATYRSMIKPAVEEAGFECVRADEIVHSGNINVPVYKELLEADMVISDLSTSNPTVFYELGVRHALRPYTTIIISEEQFRIPFDISSIAILKYKHLGDDIGYSEARRFTAALKDVITAASEQTPREYDSPVYRFINGLTPPQIDEAAQGAASVATQAASGPSDSELAHTETYGALMQQAKEAQKRSDFIMAKTLLSTVRATTRDKNPDRPEDPYLIQQLVLATYKSKMPDARSALEEARALLLTLDPATSNNTETLGLWGTVHKRLWDETHKREHLDEAVRGYKRGFYLRNDHYNGINLAYMLNVRASAATNGRAEAIADFVQARRIRSEVLAICDKVLAAGNMSPDGRFWVLATMAEALLGLGNDEGAQFRLQEAFSSATAEWMTETVNEQMGKLRALLADSPLKYLRDGEAPLA
jgi:tetratricopeptide repeat protein